MSDPSRILKSIGHEAGRCVNGRKTKDIMLHKALGGKPGGRRRVPSEQNEEYHDTEEHTEKDLSQYEDRIDAQANWPNVRNDACIFSRQGQRLVTIAIQPRPVIVAPVTRRAHIPVAAPVPALEPPPG